MLDSHNIVSLNYTINYYYAFGDVLKNDKNDLPYGDEILNGMQVIRPDNNNNNTPTVLVKIRNRKCNHDGIPIGKVIQFYV